MNFNRATDSSLGGQRTASEWVLYRHGPLMTEPDEAVFARWLAQDPENRSNYYEIESIWAGLGALAGDPLVSAIAPESMRSRRSLMQWVGSLGWRLPALAAGLLCAVFAIYMIERMTVQPEVPRFIQTAVGEQRTVTLADRSVLYLNTDSAIAVDFSGPLRRLELIRGEIHMDVAYDPSRPFVVDSGGAVVRVLGTAFDVQRYEDGRVRVAVTRGVVQVAHVIETAEGTREEAVILHPEETALLDPSFSGITKKHDDVARLTSWRQGSLDLTGFTLEEAVTEVNRYSTKRIIIGDDSIRKLPLNAVFNIHDLDRFVPSIERLLPVKVASRTDETIVLTSAP
ncbi:FecR family protein [Govanella unica]|uniref:FecR family protein n=1 Tax=Govanella unica TaxID=2975056 RepID=A0A9X3TW60_9PROT|nr:FecR family protein [Govania unica]MDA5192839.1 FecR family protein [Govania unica]